MHKNDRRAFIIGLASSLALPRRVASQAPRNPDVVVIGAGAAGLAATRTLMAMGHDVALLEAGARIGGRAHTNMSTFGVPWDIGAHWLQPGNANPYLRYAREQGFDVYRAPDNWRVFVGDRDASDDEEAALWSTWEAMTGAMSRHGEQGQDISAAEAVTGVQGAWAETAAFGIGPWEMAKDLSDVSVLDWYGATGGDDWYCREGYGTVVAHYGAGVPVSLRTRATEVDWSGDGVAVHTNRGTVRARAAILTVSTGVLGSGAIQFTPRLPVEKQESFAGISMGLYNHITLQFDEDIFGLGEDGYLFWQLRNEGGFGALTNAGGHGLAYCDVGGSWAQEVESWTSAAAIDYALSRLRGMLGVSVDRAFIRGAVTKWGQDPLTLGSYSCAEPGAYAMREVLRESVGDRVFFAGEACHPSMPATVAGAHLSGVDTATRVVEILG